jgi:hypothetical protein
MLNEALYVVVKDLCKEFIAEFESEGTDVSSYSFLSQFSYLFLTHDQSERERRVLDAALNSDTKNSLEKTIEAAYAYHAGGTFESYVLEAVQDFMNFIIPRIAGLKEGEEIFDRFYAQFDQSLFGSHCTVTTFALLSNVWDNGGRVVLPPSFLLRYYTKVHGDRSTDRWSRERTVPYFEIVGTGHPLALGRPIKEQTAFFVFSHSVDLPKSKALLREAYALRDEITRKFLFAVRLLNFSSAYADYRGFRTIGHLGMYRMNLMNFPEEVIDDRNSRELTEFDGHRLRRLLPKLAGTSPDVIAVLDTKIEDALRRRRYGESHDETARLRVTVDQLLDYFQILEAVVPAMGSEFIALYAGVLVHALQTNEDAESVYELVKRMHSIRNNVLHGRIQSVLNATKDKLSEQELQRFRHVMHVLAAGYVMNGPLRDHARKLALGKDVVLTSTFPSSTEEMNAMRRSHDHPAAWW